jgi:hypothetical protein
MFAGNYALDAIIKKTGRIIRISIAYEEQVDVAFQKPSAWSSMASPGACLTADEHAH